MRKRILSAFVAAVWALLSGRVAALPAQEPLFLVPQASPMVMLALSVDHQLFVKAFGDYTDLNGDGVIDNTYTDDFDYYGYFDSNRCYEYDSGNGWFSPRDAAIGPNGHHCGSVSGDWSGNFLNWASMTRIDVLRKALYGGKRSVDVASQTVLERALLANDTHAFAKVFAPSEGTANYTPYNVASLSLCNVTSKPAAGYNETQQIDTANNPPKMRVAEGDWGRWASGERTQCQWHVETNSLNKDAGIVPQTADNLFQAGTVDAPSVRVETCVTDKLGDNCRSYDGTNYKPIGLLQEYGEDGSLRFGLLSGSYEKRDKGGVLRKGISRLAGNTDSAADEVNIDDGTFIEGANGIVETLDKIRINAWNYTSREYADCNMHGISTDTYLTSTATDRRCSNWGNPISELYLEAVRYLIGESSPTSAFHVATDSLSLPTAAWDGSTDPMPATDFCAAMNVVLLSSGDNSFDTDHLDSVPSVLGDINASTDEIGVEEGLTGQQVFIGEVGASPAADPDSFSCIAKSFTSLSQMRGLCPSTPTKQGGYAIAGIARQARLNDLRGDRTGDQTINTYAVAMAKNLPDFTVKAGGGAVTIVPNVYAAPVGAAPPVDSTDWWASSLVQVIIEDTAYDANNDLKYVRFLTVWEDSGRGSDYDMDVITRTAICVGTACAQHDDDNDGRNDTSPGADRVRVTTRVMQKFSAYAFKVGFVASGTTADGEHATITTDGGSGTDIVAGDFSTDGSTKGVVPDPFINEFDAGSSTAQNLPSPLQLATKYGGFNDLDGDGELSSQVEWDTVDDDDELPDSFFFADDPSKIGPRLASFLTRISSVSSASAAVANTVSLRTSTRIYQALFDSADWSGTVRAFPIDSTGAVLAAEWDAASAIAGQDPDTGREWITWNPDANAGDGGGVPFRWDELSTAQQTALNINPTSGSDDGRGDERVDYLRGDDAAEVENSGSFRDRFGRPLGDIVNSAPAFVGSPSFGYPDDVESASYSTFKSTYSDTECLDSAGNLRDVDELDREPILYFGGNDGALHGISACTGEERIAYVPNSVMSELSRLTSPGYSHRFYVDGPASYVDAFINGEWRTVLVGTLRGGGSGVFALDVTDPEQFDESYADDIVLWDIQATVGAGSDFEHLGYTFSQPSIVKLDNSSGTGDWVAVFGNGFDSVSGHAVLYVVRLSDGALLQSINLNDVGPGSTEHGSANGLATVAPVDTDGDGSANLIYGGDLNGNLWRFEVSDSGSLSRATTTLLYKAKNAAGVNQKITSRVAVGYHPTSVQGRIVYFGTGKYYEAGDQDPANAVQDNTMYGIWDRDDGNTIPSVTTRNSSRLQQQEITTQTTHTFDSIDETVRVVSDTPIQWAGADSSASNYACATGQSCGWYLDLPDTGEKMVIEPILRAGRLIFVTTVPASDDGTCEGGGYGWFMEIDPHTGGRLNFSVLDLNGDGVFDINDQLPTTDEDGDVVHSPVSGTKSKVGIIQSPTIVAGIDGPDGGCENCEGKYFTGSQQGQIDVKTENAGATGEGRKSWARIR